MAKAYARHEPEKSVLHRIVRETLNSLVVVTEARDPAGRGPLEGARKTAEICVFTITDDRIAESILAAHRRGVAVRILSDNEKAHDAGSDTIALARAGIPSRIGDSPFHLRHKFAIFDGDTILTGSDIRTRGAASNNEENLIISNDRRLLTAFKGEFERLWVKFANHPLK